MDRHRYHHAGHGTGLCGRSCCSEGLAAAYAANLRAGVSRRSLILGAGAAALSSWAIAGRTARGQTPATEPDKPRFAPADELLVQPVLTYGVPRRGEQTSWRGWGGLQTERDAQKEVRHITDELKRLVAETGLNIRLLPVVPVRSPEQAANVASGKHDVLLIYAAAGGCAILNRLVVKDKPVLFFLRHRSGPISLYYEVLHPVFLRRRTDRYADTGVDVQDVVVDEYDDLAWRLRALAALRRTLGTRIVALGGALGWGVGHELAPPIAREKWHFDIRTVSYDDLARRIKKIRQDRQAIAEAKKQAAACLADPGIELHTDRKFVENAFVLVRIFKDYLREHGARAFTIGGCMTTVIPLAETTACLPLSLLNDEGYLAFCESDFVVIPAGVLMHHITQRPVFLNDPTWPHHGVVTLAHCTAPRKMNGKRAEPMKLYTHFESDYGAAPKVQMARGQMVSNVIPDFACRKWLGVLGTVQDNPFYDICRSQIDVAIIGDAQRLLEQMHGFHWMTCYGDCLKEVGYAIKHLDIAWENVSA